MAKQGSQVGAGEQLKICNIRKPRLEREDAVQLNSQGNEAEPRTMGSFSGGSWSHGGNTDSARDGTQGIEGGRKCFLFPLLFIFLTVSPTGQTSYLQLTGQLGEWYLQRSDTSLVRQNRAVEGWNLRLRANALRSVHVSVLYFWIMCLYYFTDFSILDFIDSLSLKIWFSSTISILPHAMLPLSCKCHITFFV